MMVRIFDVFCNIKGLLRVEDELQLKARLQYLLKSSDVKFPRAARHQCDQVAHGRL